MPTLLNLDRAYGVELELGWNRLGDLAPLLEQAGIPCQVENYGHGVRRWWKVTTDGSVRANDGRNGCELVSPILRGENGVRQIRLVSRALISAGVRVNRSCGFHVHHEAGDLSPAAWRALVKLFAKFEPLLDQFQTASRRESRNQFCRSLLAPDLNGRPSARSLEDLFARLDSAHTREEISNVAIGRNRYHKLNFESYFRQGTIEFRQHAGTTSGEKIIQWVAFTQALLERAKAGGRTSLTGAADWEALFRLLPYGEVKERAFTFYRARVLELGGSFPERSGRVRAPLPSSPEPEETESVLGEVADLLADNHFNPGTPEPFEMAAEVEHRPDSPSWATQLVALRGEEEELVSRQERSRTELQRLTDSGGFPGRPERMGEQRDLLAHLARELVRVRREINSLQARQLREELPGITYQSGSFQAPPVQVGMDPARGESWNALVEQDGVRLLGVAPSDREAVTDTLNVLDGEDDPFPGEQPTPDPPRARREGRGSSRLRDAQAAAFPETAAALNRLAEDDRRQEGAEASARAPITDGPIQPTPTVTPVAEALNRLAAEEVAPAGEERAGYLSGAIYVQGQEPIDFRISQSGTRRRDDLEQVRVRQNDRRSRSLYPALGETWPSLTRVRFARETARRLGEAAQYRLNYGMVPREANNTVLTAARQAVSDLTTLEGCMTAGWRFSDPENPCLPRHPVTCERCLPGPAAEARDAVRTAVNEYGFHWLCSFCEAPGTTDTGE